MSGIHVHFNILSEQKEVRIIILPIELSMTTYDLASILEDTARTLRQYPSEATIADIKEALKDYNEGSGLG